MKWSASSQMLVHLRVFRFTGLSLQAQDCSSGQIQQKNAWIASGNFRISFLKRTKFSGVRKACHLFAFKTWCSCWSKPPRATLSEQIHNENHDPYFFANLNDDLGHTATSETCWRCEPNNFKFQGAVVYHICCHQRRKMPCSARWWSLFWLYD